MATGAKARDGHEAGKGVPGELGLPDPGLPAQRYYYRGHGRDGQVLKEALKQVAGTWPTYGYRRLTAQLQREGWPVNEKRVRRLMGELGLQGKVYRKKRRTTNSDHPFPRY